MLKRYCDLCEKEITDKNWFYLNTIYSNEIVTQNRSHTITWEVCASCLISKFPMNRHEVSLKNIDHDNTSNKRRLFDIYSELKNV